MLPGQHMFPPVCGRRRLPQDCLNAAKELDSAGGGAGKGGDGRRRKRAAAVKPREERHPPGHARLPSPSLVSCGSSGEAASW